MLHNFSAGKFYSMPNLHLFNCNWSLSVIFTKDIKSRWYSSSLQQPLCHLSSPLPSNSFNISLRLCFLTSHYPYCYPLDWLQFVHLSWRVTLKFDPVLQLGFNECWVDQKKRLMCLSRQALVLHCTRASSFFTTVALCSACDLLDLPGPFLQSCY